MQCWFIEGRRPHYGVIARARELPGSQLLRRNNRQPQEHPGRRPQARPIRWFAAGCACPGHFGGGLAGGARSGAVAGVVVWVLRGRRRSPAATCRGPAGPQRNADALCRLLRAIGRRLGKPVLMTPETDPLHPVLGFDVAAGRAVLLAEPGLGRGGLVPTRHRRRAVAEHRGGNACSSVGEAEENRVWCLLRPDLLVVVGGGGGAAFPRMQWSATVNEGAPTVGGVGSSPGAEAPAPRSSSLSPECLPSAPLRSRAWIVRGTEWGTCSP